jgi:hypothetical protein
MLVMAFLQAGSLNAAEAHPIMFGELRLVHHSKIAPAMTG